MVFQMRNEELKSKKVKRTGLLLEKKSEGRVSSRQPPLFLNKIMNWYYLSVYFNT